MYTGTHIPVSIHALQEKDKKGNFKQMDINSENHDKVQKYPFQEKGGFFF